MVKYYCDCCGEEAPEIPKRAREAGAAYSFTRGKYRFEVEVTKKTPRGKKYRWYPNLDLCKSCTKEIVKAVIK